MAAQRAVPDDIPTAREQPINANLDTARLWAAIAEPVERRLRQGPAPRSALTPGQQLAALLLAGQHSGAALSADTRDAIAGLDPEAAARLGLAARPSRRRLLWPTARRQRKHTRDTPVAAAGGGYARRLRDAKRAAAGLIADSIPPDAIARVEACAVDRVLLPATAANPADNRAGNGGGAAGAALSDSDGRLLRNSDPDALSNGRSAAIRARRPAGRTSRAHSDRLRPPRPARRPRSP